MIFHLLYLLFTFFFLLLPHTHCACFSPKLAWKSLFIFRLFVGCSVHASLCLPACMPACLLVSLTFFWPLFLLLWLFAKYASKVSLTCSCDLLNCCGCCRKQGACGRVKETDWLEMLKPKNTTTTTIRKTKTGWNKLNFPKLWNCLQSLSSQCSVFSSH